MFNSLDEFALDAPLFLSLLDCNAKLNNTYTHTALNRPALKLAVGRPARTLRELAKRDWQRCPAKQAGRANGRKEETC